MRTKSCSHLYSNFISYHSLKCKYYQYLGQEVNSTSCHQSMTLLTSWPSETIKVVDWVGYSKDTRYSIHWGLNIHLFSSSFKSSSHNGYIIHSFGDARLVIVNCILSPSYHILTFVLRSLHMSFPLPGIPVLPLYPPRYLSRLLGHIYL